MFESAFNMTRTPRPHSCISRCSNVTSMECLGNTPRPGPGRHRTPASAAGALSQFWLKPVRQRRRLTASLRAGVVEHYTARMSSRRVAATAGTGTVDCGNSEGRRGATAAAGAKVLGPLEPVGLPPARLGDRTGASVTPQNSPLVCLDRCSVWWHSLHAFAHALLRQGLRLRPWPGHVGYVFPLRRPSSVSE